MTLRSLYLQHFRIYEEIFVEFNPSINLICGPNAKGKTTLLEAIRYAMIGRSFRTCNPKDLIQNGFHSFFLDLRFLKHGIDQVLRFSSQGSERKILYNHTILPNMCSLLGVIQGVVITPDDVQLIKGSPAMRRQFLDIQLSQTDPLYVHHLTRYARAMRHRNILLKQKQLATIESWEQEMAHSTAYIVRQRQKIVQELHHLVSDYYHALSGEIENLILEYQPSLLSIEPVFFMEQLRKNRHREMLLGHTLTGPHKDDLSIKIGSREVRLFASEGQQRSCVNAIHFAEWKRLKSFSEDKNPLFMIDDVAMSLDTNRKERLMEQLKHLGQVFLTTTDPSLLNNAHKIILE
ncbi:MAG: DNA replication and repair protein RecF [Candidatus Protochlamydia sp.]|nr:DNA replication and repair protein RecF [Candidatus Protochlamydia sp.]